VELTTSKHIRYSNDVQRTKSVLGRHSERTRPHREQGLCQAETGHVHTGLAAGNHLHRHTYSGSQFTALPVWFCLLGSNSILSMQIAAVSHLREFISKANGMYKRNYLFRMNIMPVSPHVNSMCYLHYELMHIVHVTSATTAL